MKNKIKILCGLIIILLWVQTDGRKKDKDRITGHQGDFKDFAFTFNTLEVSILLRL